MWRKNGGKMEGEPGGWMDMKVGKLFVDIDYGEKVENRWRESGWRWKE